MMGDKPYRILRIPVMNVACYLVYKDQNAILIDTGTRGNSVKVLEMLDHLGLKTESLKLIVITHGHYDHAGSAREIHQHTGAPVAVHRLDADRLREGYGPLPDGTRWKARLLVTIGRMFFKRLGRIPAIDPDIIIDEKLDLNRYGIPGSVLHMPGHTIGSVVVLLDDGDLIAGDTLFGIKGKEIFPPFADDRISLLQSWAKLVELPVNYFYPGHGAKIRMADLRKEFDMAKVKYGNGKV